ncbi:MAG: DinB family protein [Acidobacteria bacterium]|nr:DinB family protein [Acidobacteriota bacterium]
MTLSDTLLPEFDQETAKTRKAIERVPADRWNWKPHDKSMTLGELTSHLATLLTWVANTIDHDSFDLGPNPPKGQALGGPAEALAAFDENTQAARAAIAAASDETFMATWSLRAGGKTFFAVPKADVLRSFVMNHMIHHRAQLGVYLRLNDIPVPATYGPSADEQIF